MTDQKPKLVYISGPMKGYDYFNYPAFNAASAKLQDEGYIVLNPASNFEGVRNLAKETYMKHDFSHVLQADLLVVLKGWEESKGARSEVVVAQLCGLQVYRFEDWMPYQTDIVRTYVR